jgi:putative ABC transport system permease protein
MALGAARGHVLRMVVGEGLKIGAAGLVLGVAASLALTRLMSGLLFGVSERDPLTFVALPLALLAVAAAAAWIPARRALQVDPMVALRTE